MWNDKFGNNFTDNQGYMHQDAMQQKNYETAGSYQATVSGMYGEFTLAAVMKALPNEFHVLNDICIDTGIQYRPYQPQIYGESPWRIVVKNNKQFEEVHKSSQLDHVIVSTHGIFIIETKNHKGYIFGDVNGKVWTQVLNNGREHYTFFSPVSQNALHVKHFSDKVKIPVVASNGIPCIHGMIVFTNPDANLDNVNCSCCYTLESLYQTLMYMQQYNLWSEQNSIKIIQHIEAKDSNSYLKAQEHITYVKDTQRRAEIAKMRKRGF